ncbi:hypothetical protein tb265_19040 [Gemmatimonadetes bacterium T265]|nr:hypothetical protein tb265_19040 [Gemmatimonadetes bacterium T265]
MTPPDPDTLDEAARAPERAVPAPIDCHTAVQRLWDYLDGRLPPVARDEVEVHLAVCALCPPHFAFARTMQQALAASAPSTPDDEDARLRERVRRALRS